MAYADKRDGKLTGRWTGEVFHKELKKRFKRNFATKREAEDYETFVRMIGREPPAISEGLERTGAPTFSDVLAMAKRDGGPSGKWKSQRDPSLMQRLDYCARVIGHYEITQVNRQVLNKITESLDRQKAPGKAHLRLSPSTINRYLSAAGTVLTYAHLNDLLDHRPTVPLLTAQEKRTAKQREILAEGQEDVILRLMRAAGHTVEATCVEALLETGLRAGELIEQLRPDQVELDQNQNAGWINLEKGQTKNNEARRVHIRWELAREIKAIIAAGSMPKADKLRDTFTSARNLAGFPETIVIHSLRHTRNTRLRKAGVEKKIRMKMLGHKSELVSDRYDHVDDADQLEAVKKVAQARGVPAKNAPDIPSQVIDFARSGAG